MSQVDLTAVAAFTAAGLSLVSVVLTYRLNSRGHREQWRRDQERPTVARCLTLSDEARGEWRDASKALEDMSVEKEPHWGKGLQLLRDLHYEAAQLDLLASRPVRQAAAGLVAAHEEEANRLTTGHAIKSAAAQVRAPSWNDFEGRQASRVKILELEAVLVERTRADLGLGAGFQVPPRSLLARMLGRYQ